MATPVPESDIGTLMLPAALTVNVGSNVPAAVGLNVNVTVQSAPAASVAPHVVLRE